jgi:DNA-binding NarL/FixJ family response regulator
VSTRPLPTLRTARAPHSTVAVSLVEVTTSSSDSLDRLTPRESDVLALMAEGRSNAAIAQGPP